MCVCAQPRSQGVEQYAHSPLVNEVEHEVSNGNEFGVHICGSLLLLILLLPPFFSPFGVFLPQLKLTFLHHHLYPCIFRPTGHFWFNYQKDYKYFLIGLVPVTSFIIRELLD